MQLNQKGQSLVEVIVALGVLVVVIVGFTNIILTSLQNAQYARRQETATQYARNAIESIRVMRDQSIPLFLNDAGTSTLSWEDIWAEDTIDDHLTAPNNCYALTENFPTFVLKKVNCTQVNVLDNNLYSRTISISCFQRQNGSTNCGGAGPVAILNIQTVVTWTDSKGNHSAEVSSNLARWQ